MKYYEENHIVIYWQQIMVYVLDILKWRKNYCLPKIGSKALQDIARTIDVLIVLRSMKVSPDSLKIIAKLMLTIFIRLR